MLYKLLAFLAEKCTFSSLFNIANGGRGRSRQGVPRLLTDPVTLKRHVKCHVIIGTCKFVKSCVFAVFYCKFFLTFLNWALEKKGKTLGCISCNYECLVNFDSTSKFPLRT